MSNNRSITYLAGSALLLFVGCGIAQQRHAADLATSTLLSEPGPTFRLSDAEIADPATVIAYGDMRFTDPADTTDTDPKVRKWLVEQIARERPAAVLLNGDVPYNGSNQNDYAVYQQETAPWRAAGLHVYPALGNHEFHGPDPQQCLENWWHAFPELRNRRWYASQIGSRIYAIALDSDASLVPGSDQAKWLGKQITDLPATIDFVIISLHHPPVADFQTRYEVSHNPRPNEISLRDLLRKLAPATHARFIVSAGHIHNYERHLEDGVVYLVSGGGGARPYPVERTKDDLFQSDLFPNYHYLKFSLQADRLQAAMYRVADPNAAQLKVEMKDRFEVTAKPQAAAASAGRF